ncbi:hypothetical protein COPEUT_02304 [Coprococcus eutactus ATCC 27759]|nr:hypothetical protein COPEUT_02304 [Coprococcus eutactus ATCC 27759]
MSLEKQFQNSLLYLHHVKCLIYVTYVRHQKNDHR